MQSKDMEKVPRRVSDLVDLKARGFDVTVEPSFEILPVDFAHKAHQFQAYIFLCRYSGTVEDRDFSFRKCYARGCPHNLCPHVAQAVMIANRYLLRDFRRMKEAGIAVDEKMFTLDEMVVKFEGLREDQGPLMTLFDFIAMAREGTPVSAEVELEIVPAVEHFAGEKNKQTFLNADFAFTALGQTAHTHRCLGCYATADEARERSHAVGVANERLATLYREFEEAGIPCRKVFFE